MPGFTKKWDLAADLDLCLAVIWTGGASSSYKWPEVHEIMTSLGHDFTKDAISQHFTKTILKDFKTRHGMGPGKLSAAMSPSKRKASDDDDANAGSPSRKKATPRSAKKTGDA